MPGIADDRSPAVNPALIAGVGQNTAQVTPAVTDFMDAFRNGFITVDDIHKRTRENVVADTQAKTQVQAEDFKRRRMAEQEQLAPSALDVQRKGLQAQGGALDTQIAAQPGQTGAAAKQSNDVLDLINPATRPQALNRLEQEKLEQGYAEIVGNLPDKVPVSKPIQPASFQDWFSQNVAGKGPAERAAAFQPNVNTPEANAARAKVYNMTDEQLAQSPEVQKAYHDYVQEAQSHTTDAVRGTPEYNDHLRREIFTRSQQLAVQGAKVKAIPGVIEAQAKAEAERPKRQQEFEKDIHTEIQNDTVLKPIAEAKSFLGNAKSVLSKPENKITNADDQLLVESLIKLTDPQGVIRQSKVEYLQEMTPFLQGLQKKVQHAYSTQGGVLTPSDRQQIKGAIEIVDQNFNRASADRLKLYNQRAQKLGIAPGDIFDSEQLGVLKGNVGSSLSTPASPAASSQPQGSAVPTVQTAAEARQLDASVPVFRTPDGRLLQNPNYKANGQ